MFINWFHRENFTSKIRSNYTSQFIYRRSHIKDDAYHWRRLPYIIPTHLNDKIAITTFPSFAWKIMWFGQTRRREFLIFDFAKRIFDFCMTEDFYYDFFIVYFLLYSCKTVHFFFISIESAFHSIHFRICTIISLCRIEVTLKMLKLKKIYSCVGCEMIILNSFHFHFFGAVLIESLSFFPLLLSNYTDSFTYSKAKAVNGILSTILNSVKSISIPLNKEVVT